MIFFFFINAVFTSTSMRFLDGLCSVIGTWTTPPVTGSLRVEISQAAGAGKFAVRFGPTGAEHGSGTLTQRDTGEIDVSYTLGSKLYQGVANASTHAAWGSHAAAPPCSSFVWTDSTADPWCMHPYCGMAPPNYPPYPPVPISPTAPPTAPPPYDPPTQMTTIPIPNAVALGAVYPNGDGAFYTMNTNPNRSTGWIIHSALLALTPHATQLRS